jgi:beta-lactamase class A
VFEQELAGRLELDAEVVLKRTDKASGSGVLKRTRSGTRLTVASLVELMLQRSDNTATNILTDLLGLEEINEACRRQGLTATCMPRYIMDLEARDNNVENFTSATDMGHLLKAIYEQRVLDAPSATQLLEILKGQRVRDRLPRYLPRGVVLAHKTGLMKDACHDVGILYGRNHDYVVAVLTTVRLVHAGQAGDRPDRRAVYQYDAGEKITPPTVVRRRRRGAGENPLAPGLRPPRLSTGAPAPPRPVRSRS